MSAENTLGPLTLPEPASRLWRAARDVVSTLLPPERGWRRCFGGGTILAAQWGHRKSTDIDMIMKGSTSLHGIAEPLARGMGGVVSIDSDERIVIVKGDGKLDVSMAEIRPAEGQKTATIDDVAETVLSTTQIMRGKLTRTVPGPVRDAYDMIAAAQIDKNSAGSLAAAYNMLSTTNKLLVEASLRSADDALKEEALTSLWLTEESRVDWDVIGTTTARVLEGMRLRDVEIELQGDVVVTRRNTRGGLTVEDRSDVERAPALWTRTGVEPILRRAQQAPLDLQAAIEEHQRKGFNGMMTRIVNPERPSPFMKADA